MRLVFRALMSDIAMIAGKDPTIELGGGHSAFVRAHALAAKAAGYEPHLFCIGARTHSRATAFGAVHTLRNPWPLGPGVGLGVRNALLPLLAPLLETAVVRFAARHQQPLVVHGFGPWWSSVAASAAWACRPRAASVGSIYTSMLHERDGKLSGLRGARRRDAIGLYAEQAWMQFGVLPGVRRHLRGMDQYLVNYDSVLRRLQREDEWWTPVRKIPFAPEWAFEALPSPDRQPSPGVPVIVCIARHDPRKGVDRLIRACAILRDGGVPFRARLVGNGDLLAAHRTLVERLGLAGIVSVEGFVEDGWGVLREGDLFVLPSLQEGSGSLAMVEAMAMGLPIVASAIDGIPEDMDAGVEGLLVEPDDPSALAAALARLLRDPELRLAMGAAARKRFERQFAPGPFVEALADVYASLGAAPGRG